MKFNEELDLAVSTAQQAGELLVKRAHVTVDSQTGRDIKLSVDRESEALILRLLSSSGYPVLSEESGAIAGQGDYYWVVDPLDGSLNYFRGLEDLCCVSIALWKNAKPILGVINRFYTQDMYIGLVGEGAWRNGKPISPSKQEMVEQSIVGTGFPTLGDFSDESIMQRMRSLMRFKKIRLLGTAALSGAFVAEGKLDSYMEEKIMFWDIAASCALIKAAGGCIDIQMLNDNKCICRCFSSKKLQENYYDKIV